MGIVTFKKPGISLFLCMTLLLTALFPVWSPLSQTAKAAEGGDSGTRQIEFVQTPNMKAIVNGFSGNLRLPETVEVTLDDQSLVDVSVVWDTSGLDLETNGQYTLPGTLDLTDHADILNPNDLTAVQRVMVRDEINLLANPGFESGTTDWSAGSGTRTKVDAPVHEGASALKATGYEARYHLASQSVKDALEAQGPGEYRMSGWAQLGEGLTFDPTDNFAMTLEVSADHSPSGDHKTEYYLTNWMNDWAYPDDAARTAAQQRVGLNDTAFSQASNRTLIEWEGAIAAASFSFVTTNDAGFPTTMYMDSAELVPLNVTLPNQDIVSFSSVSLSPVYVGTSFDDLGLPATVNATLEDGSTRVLPVNWDDSAYLGETEAGSYSITGLFDLTGTTITNTKDFKINTTVEVKEVGAELGATYYFASTGDDSKDGLTPETAKRSIDNIRTFMTPGTTILLNRGDEWHVPGLAWDFSGIKGTESAPIVIGAYGSGAAPVVADMHKLSASDWEETASGSGIWSADLADNVKRLYVDEQIWAPAASVAVLADHEYVQTDSKVYVKSASAPEKVEVIPSDEKRLITYSNSEFITVKDITLKGGGNWAAVYGTAPTRGLVFDHITLKQIYKYGIVMENGSAVDAVHKDLLITDSLLDRVWSAAMYENDHSELTSDGILLRNAIDGAMIRRNTIINFGHTGINGEASNSAYPGVKNMIYEDNTITKGASNYLRAWEVTGLAGKAEHNIVRRNVGYDLTGSSHFLGEYNLAYSNIFYFITTTTAATNTKQPYAIDMMPWADNNGQFVSDHNIVANNTIYSTKSAIFMNGAGVGVNTIVNNLFIDWVDGEQGLVIDSAVSNPQIVKNNGFWNLSDTEAVIRQGTQKYTVAQANALANFTDNIQADPKFKDAANHDFSLTSESPYKDTGLPISSMMDAGFTDFYGNPFDAYAPSIGAIQYQRPVDNLVTNPGYEDSPNSWSPWDTKNANEAQNVSLVTGEAAFKGNSLLVTNRTQNYHGSMQSVLSKLNAAGPGDYYVQVRAKLGKGASPVMANVALELKEDGASASKYINTYAYPGGWPEGYAGNTVIINDSAYTKISNTIPLDWSGNLTTAQLYFQTDTGAVPDIYLDDWMLVKAVQVESVAEYPGKVVLKGTDVADLKLPVTADAELEDGSHVKLQVAWNANAYDANALGAQTISGSLILPDGISNREQLGVSIQVVVKDALNIVDIVGVEDQAVDYGKTFAEVTSQLPTRVDTELEDGSHIALDVTWQEGNYDGGAAGDYAVTGELVLPSTVSNSNSVKPQVTITVMPRISKGEELLINPDFENGIEGWSSPWGGTIEPVTYNVTGNAILSVRSGNSNTAVQDVTDAVIANGQGPYYLQTWLKAKEGTLQDARTLVRIEDDKGQRWLYVPGPGQTIDADQFTKVSGVVNITWSGTLKEVLFAAVETAAGSTGDVVIANASFKSLELLKNAGFEDGIQHWDEATWGGKLESVDSPIHSGDGSGAYAGSKALASVERDVAWRGPIQDITSMLKRFGPGTYHLSANARLAEGNNKVQVGIRYILNDDGVERTSYSDMVDVNSTEYTHLEAAIDASWADTVTSAQFIISTTVNPAPATVFYDDFSMTADQVLQEGPKPISEPDPTDGDSIDAYIGENFDLAIGLNDVTQAFSAVNLTITYDPSELEFATKPLGYEDYPDALALADEAIYPAPENPGLQILGTAILQNGSIHVVALTTGEPLISAEHLFILHGKVKSDTAEGTTPVTLSEVALAQDGVDFPVDGNAYTIEKKIRSVDKTALGESIDSAQSVLSSAVEGTQPGEYPAGAKALLQQAINEAQAVFDDPDADQDQVMQELANLQQSLNLFNGSVIVAQLDKTMLTEWINIAQSKHDAAVEGVKVTQYEAGAKATLQAAINQAASVRGAAVSQQALNDAQNALALALETFQHQIVTLIPGESQITIKDISLLAKYYGKTREEANWDQYDTADIYGEGITIQVLAKVARMILEDWLSQQ